MDSNSLGASELSLMHPLFNKMLLVAPRPQGRDVRDGSMCW